MLFNSLMSKSKFIAKLKPRGEIKLYIEWMKMS